LEADKGAIDAGAISFVDLRRVSAHYEPIANYGIGMRRAAMSVLLFSNREMPHLRGMCAVTDETSTSFRLLQQLLEVRYGLRGVHYGRIASSVMFDGGADALLLIGDEALRAKEEGIPGLPFVTDLGEEWFAWQNVPFVFARWAVRRSLPQDVKAAIRGVLERSLETNERNMIAMSEAAALERRMDPLNVRNYWNGFAFKLSPENERSIKIFSDLLEKACSNA
jgi:chorismate dehydratase